MWRDLCRNEWRRPMRPTHAVRGLMANAAATCPYGKGHKEAPRDSHVLASKRPERTCRSILPLPPRLLTFLIRARGPALKVLVHNRPLGQRKKALISPFAALLAAAPQQKHSSRGKCCHNRVKNINRNSKKLKGGNSNTFPTNHFFKH